MKTISELEDFSEIVAKLKTIAGHLLNKNKLRLAFITIYRISLITLPDS